MDQLVPVNSIEDIFPIYRDTPISKMLQYHNLELKYEFYENAELLIGMCMDNRKKLHIPENFAYIIRTGGGNLRFSEFKISYAIAVGGIKSIALIGHDHCGMVNLMSKKEIFINALINDAGWDPSAAEDHFLHFAPMFEIGNELDFVMSETKRLRLRYPKIQVAPFFYKLEDNKLYQIKED
ncbi:MAG: carbonic anhydrase [Patescibacteria group bacterium]|nr:carbonic anhydrase [Patescibacteria group bacterium]